MVKYIDADLLRKEIENCKEAMSDAVGEYSDGVRFALEHFTFVLDSIQQEQPEVDLVAKLKHHLATTPKEQLEKEWKELEHWNNVGPTVQEFLYGKQPEVDLEKEIDACWQNWISPSNQKEVEGVLPKTEFAMYARHFYSLGKQAKKEE